MKSGVRFLLTLALAAIAAILTVSCRHTGKTVYAYFANVDDTGWDPFSEVVFCPWPIDSVITDGEKFDLALCIRYRADSPIRSLPLALRFESDADDAVTTDTVTLQMPLHEGLSRRQALCESCDTIRRGITLQPGFMLTVTPLLNKEDAKGIVNIGAVLSRR